MGSVTSLLGAAKTGHPGAAEQLHERCRRRVVGLARKLLGGVRLGVADEQDVAIDVFDSLFRGLAAGCKYAEGFTRLEAYQRGLTSRILP